MSKQPIDPLRPVARKRLGQIGELVDRHLASTEQTWGDVVDIDVRQVVVIEGRRRHWIVVVSFADGSEVKSRFTMEPWAMTLGREYEASITAQGP